MSSTGGTAGTPTAMSHELESPLTVGDYKILKTIHKGKSTVWYRAQRAGGDAIDKQTVVLKVTFVDVMNEDVKVNFSNEVRLVQSLSHPNIIHCLGSFITASNAVEVYEWAAAGDLKRQLRKTRESGCAIGERQLWKYFSQICNAIKHIHDKRILHRDIKPANVLLTLSGTVKMANFGLSIQLGVHEIHAHGMVGTPLYMAPEVLNGKAYDFKADMWSLGCVLYELAMLRSPFKAAENQTLSALSNKICDGDYEALPDTHSNELRDLVYAMLSPRPEDRPDIAHVCDMAQCMHLKFARQGTRGCIMAIGAAMADKL